MNTELPESTDAYTEPTEAPAPRAGGEVGFYPAADHAARTYAAMFRFDADRKASEVRESLYYALSEAACAALDASADLVVFNTNSPLVHDVTTRFGIAPYEWPAHAFTITADRTHARVYVNDDPTAHITEPTSGAVIFTDGDALEFAEPVPPAVPGEDVAGVVFTVRRGGSPEAFVYAMPAVEVASGSVVSGGIGWKAVRAGSGRKGDMIRTVFGDDRAEATRIAEAYADAARAAIVAEVISGSPALSLAEARAMVEIDRAARGEDADEERDIRNLIDTARHDWDPTAG